MCLITGREKGSLRAGTSIQLQDGLGSLDDIHADGRPPLARVERILEVKGSIWMAVRRFLYKNSLQPNTECPVVVLAPVSQTEYLPATLSVVESTRVIHHLCKFETGNVAHRCKIHHANTHVPQGAPSRFSTISRRIGGICGQSVHQMIQTNKYF